MNIVGNKFTKFMCGALKFLLVINLIASIGIIFVSLTVMNVSVIVFGILALLSLFAGYKLINMNMSSKNKLLLILIIGFLLRILWLLNINSIPNSDFKTMYDCAVSLLNGDKTMFYGVGYIGRFPHFTVMTLYMALMRYLFPISNLMAMKIINLFSSISVLFLIYFIVKELFNNKEYALKATLIGSIFPPFITYTGVFCSENIAMPFYLLSIYLFLLGIKNKRNLWIFILCGVALALGNLIRMIASVVLIAYVIYMFIYSNEHIFRKIKNMTLIVIPYVIIICSVSLLLQNAKITEYPLWGGSEPNITSVLRGTNYKSSGTWNIEDANLVAENINNYDEVERLCKEIIKERLTTTPVFKLTMFYLTKFSIQWSDGDLSGALWSQKDVEESKIIFPVKQIDFIAAPVSMIFQMIYTLILFLVLLGLFNKDKLNENKEINLFYLILCGYGVTYLITEAQPRYSYIACWVFIILAVNGLDLIKNRNITLGSSKKYRLKNRENQFPSITK